jgi:hypothetical protein
MNIIGQVMTLEVKDSFVSLHLGNYEKGGEVMLQAKFWASNVPLDKVVMIFGVCKRNQDNSIFIDVKDFFIVTDPYDGIKLQLYLSVHGEISKENSIVSNSWHSKELGVCGNFVTKVTVRSKDPVSLF